MGFSPSPKFNYVTKASIIPPGFNPVSWSPVLSPWPTGNWTLHVHCHNVAQSKSISSDLEHPLPHCRLGIFFEGENFNSKSFMDTSTSSFKIVYNGYSNKCRRLTDCRDQEWKAERCRRNDQLAGITSALLNSDDLINDGWKTGKYLRCRISILLLWWIGRGKRSFLV